MLVFKMLDSVPSVTFVMYCVYGESGSSLLIEFTDSMIGIYIYFSAGATFEIIFEFALSIYIISAGF